MGDCAIISAMSNNTLSANSQNIKKFQLHEKGKNILLVILIVAPIFIAGVIYTIYTQLTSQSSSVQTAEDLTPQTGLDPFASSDSTNSANSNPQLSGGDSNQVTQNPDEVTSAPATQAPSSAPSTSSIPPGVVSAINSIEANGIKGSPYIASTLDTSDLPTGTTIRFDRNSWSSFGAESGTLRATATVYGQTYPGSVTFGVENGTWKATGYDLGN